MSLKKKSIFLVISLIVFIVLVICYLFIIPSNGNVIIESGKSNQFVSTSALTMMYETEVDSGEYQISANNTWLGDEYIFNETLSKCENGGTLFWNNDTKRVVMQTNASDKCYVYFDKYNMPYISNVEVLEVTDNSITVTVNAIEGDADITTYYYSSNGGNTYVMSNSNTYAFTGLDADTNYNINIYALDNNGRESNIYDLDIVTDSGLLSFTFTDYVSGETTTYYAEEGMTWWDFINSDYNDGSFSTNCGDEFQMMYKGRLTNIYSTASEVITSRNYSNYAGFPERCGDVSIS